MALITDPDNLDQGTEFAVANFVITTPGVGADSTFTGTSMGSLIATDFFEIREHSDPLANGLWRVVTVNGDTSDYEVDKISNGAVPATAGSEAALWLGDDTTAADEKSVYLDTLVEEIWLLEQGDLSIDGVEMRALHSFIKDRWKDDQLLIDSGAFPMVGISFAAGQWEFGEDPSGNNSDWKLKVDVASSVDSVRLIRKAGFDEKDNAGVTQKKFFNVTTLGTFEDTLDQAEFFFGSDFQVDNTMLYAFTGVVDEPVQYYDNITPADAGTGFAFTTSDTLTRNDGGDWIAEGYVEGGLIEISNANLAANDNENTGDIVILTISATVLTTTGTPWTNDAADNVMTSAYDNKNAFTTIIRVRDADPKGKTFDSADLAAAGETAISSKVIKFPLANAPDQDIDATDGQVVTSPWTEVRLRYLAGTYNRAVDSVTLRDWGIVADVGTYSQSNGVSIGTVLVTSADLTLGAGEDLTDYTGGTLTIHDATAPDRDTHTISGTPVDNGGTLEITLTSALTNSESALSFTMDRLVPITPVVQNIYEKIQYQLRQATDIDESVGTIIGKMTGPLAAFVGANITFGGAQSPNDNGGGTGVIVEGFNSNDTNNMFFVDNGGTARNFPFVAAGNLVFNTNLTADTDPEFFMYFEYTTRTNLADAATVGPSADTMDLESPGSFLPALIVNDYIRLAGFAEAGNNGLFIVTVVNVSTQDYTVRRVDGEDVGTAETTQTIDVDENPFNSPDAILVNDNAGSPIVGAASTSPVSFDFDYDNNIQGGRDFGEDADIVLKAIGLETGQYVEVQGLTITRATGLSFSATAALERNYDNP
jgi:hypothetical protein